MTGAVGWMAYILCYDLLSVSAPVAVLIATLPLTLCARFFSVYHKAPVTVFLLPGIFPLVPGAGIYYTAYYFLRDDRTLFLNKGVETLKSPWLWPWALRWCAVCRCPAANIKIKASAYRAFCHAVSGCFCLINR